MLASSSTLLPSHQGTSVIIVIEHPGPYIVIELVRTESL